MRRALERVFQVCWVWRCGKRRVASAHASSCSYANAGWRDGGRG
eukprot:COSAG01_NODE_64811_length_275_cov_0.630682_1_plen_43_part_10